MVFKDEGTMAAKNCFPCCISQRNRTGRIDELLWRRCAFMVSTIVLFIISFFAAFYYSTGSDTSGFSAAGAAICFIGSGITGFLTYNNNRLLIGALPSTPASPKLNTTTPSAQLEPGQLPPPHAKHPSPRPPSDSDHPSEPASP